MYDVIEFMKTELQKSPSVSDFDKVCRVCLSQSRLQSIFKFKYLSPEDLVRKMRKCLGLKISRNDDMPDKICKMCMDIINMAFHIKILSEKADVKLREILKHSKQETKDFAAEVQVPDIDVKTEINMDLDTEFCDVKNSEILQQSPNIPILNDVCPTIKVEQKYSSSENDDCQTDSSDDENINLKKLRGRRKINNVPKKVMKNNGFKMSSDNSSFHQKLPSKGALKLHIADMHAKKRHENYTCHGCEKVFYKKTVRLQHEKKYCPKMPPGSNYQCRKCPVELRTRKALESHMTQHDGGSCNTLEFGRLLTCRLCHETLSSVAILRNHMRFKHSDATGAVCCPICDKSVVHKEAMFSHLMLHRERMHACDQCDYRTNLRNSLVLHKRKHTGERPYACEWCTHRTVNISNLMRHQLTHTGIQKFECAECGKKYKDKCTLVDHISSFHRRLRPYFCDKCGLRYSTKKHLGDHIRLKHTQLLLRE